MFINIRDALQRRPGRFFKKQDFQPYFPKLGNGFCSTNGLETLEDRQFSLGTIIATHEEQYAARCDCKPPEQHEFKPRESER